MTIYSKEIHEKIMLPMIQAGKMRSLYTEHLRRMEYRVP